MTNKNKAIDEALGGTEPDVVVVHNAKEGYVWVNRTAYGEEVVNQEQIKVADFQGQPTGHVAVSAHYTKNLGNYESARIGVEIMLPILASESEAIRVYDLISTMVTEILSEQVAAVSKN